MNSLEHWLTYGAGEKLIQALTAVNSVIENPVFRSIWMTAARAGGAFLGMHLAKLIQSRRDDEDDDTDDD